MRAQFSYKKVIAAAFAAVVATLFGVVFPAA